MSAIELGYFNDLRLQKKGARVLERLRTRLSATMRRLGDSRAEVAGATRFFRNPKVKPDEILQTAAARTAEAAAGRHVLLILDTSEINFASKAGRKRGLGRVGNGSDAGLFIHPALAVAASDGAVLGLAGASLWRRMKTKAADYQSQPIETKESYRWIKTARQSRAALVDTPMATVIHDRESDIYQVFARVPQLGPAGPQTHLLVRCHYNRTLDAKGGLLNDKIDTWPEAGRIGLELEGRAGRPPRHVTLALRRGQVTLAQPSKGADPNDPKQLTINVVEAREIDPPAGQAPVHWRLFTTHTVDTAEQAAWVVELYRSRWIIEQLLRTLKTKGLAIEDSFIADGEALENLAATALVAATQVMQCVHARGEAGASIPAARVFAPADMPVLEALAKSLEGKTQKQKNPHPPNSLAWAVWVIARLGGWTGYASERPPGPITMLNGLQRYHTIAQGFLLAQT